MELLVPVWFIYVIVGVGAAIVGSFVTMALARFHTGMGWGGRSHCLSCRTQLGWRDLFPVVSCLLSRARCRHCGAHYGWWHFGVEATLVASTLLLWHAFGLSLEFFVAALSAAVLVFISFYDLRHMIIPDKAIAVLFLLSLIPLVAEVIGGSLGFASFAQLHGVGLLAIPLPFLVLWAASRGKWMGMGDIKLMAWIGFSLGWIGGVDALVLGFWAGGLVGVSILVLRACSRLGFSFSPEMKRMLFAPQIPFGPFLAVGWLLAVLGVGIVGILV